jgi:hypothetical protein
MTLTTSATALFTSPLQPSEMHTRAQLGAAIRFSIRTHFGAGGCAAAVAQEYGEHPEAAAARMRWALAEAAALDRAYAVAA